jgi:CRP-like cAMP-binding protein
MSTLLDEQDWRIIKSTPLFNVMPVEAIRSIIGSRGPKSYDKGAMLFHQGDKADAFFLILDGWVKLFRINAEGLEAVIGVFSRGECFAEAAMFLGGRYPVSAEVVTSSRLLRFDGSALRRVIDDEPELAFSMLASSSHHLKLLVEQIEEIKVLSAPRRVAEFLMRLCPRKECSCVVGLPYEKALIANRLGMKPESFSRALARLRPLGVVVSREHVAIANVAALSNYVESGEMTMGSVGLSR